MPFGNSITDFTRVAAGTTANVLAVSLLANRLHKIRSVQLKSTAGAYSETVTSPLSVPELFKLLNSADPPDVAFAQTATVVYVFLNATTYPWASTNEIGFFYWTNAIPVGSLVSGKLDIPQAGRGFLKAIVIRMDSETKRIRTEWPVHQNVIREKKRLGFLS